jgi:hypothetical protein
VKVRLVGIGTKLIEIKTGEKLMPLNVKDKANTVAKPVFEDGETYFARVVQVVDLGLQPGGEYQGEAKPDKEEILVTFEFGEVLNGEGKPAWLSVTLALPDRWEDGGYKGMHVKSNLYKYLSILCPSALFKGKSANYVNFSRGFKFWESLLNTTAQLEVKVYDKENNKASIVRGSISKVPAKFLSSVPALQNDPVSINFSNVTVEQWKALYPWVRTKIASSIDPEVQELAAKMEALIEGSEPAPKAKTTPKPSKSVYEDLDDGIPF